MEAAFCSGGNSCAHCLYLEAWNAINRPPINSAEQHNAMPYFNQTQDPMRQSNYSSPGGDTDFQDAYSANQAQCHQKRMNPMFATLLQVATNQNHLLSPQVANDASEDENKFQCPHCGDKLCRAYDLRQHISNKHINLHFCMVYYCGREFGTLEELEDHMEKDHKEEDRDKVLKKGTNGGRSSTVCPFCERSIAASSIYRHFETTCSACGSLSASAVRKCELHIPCTMYFKNAEEKKKHDETVHKNHRGFIKSAIHF